MKKILHIPKQTPNAFLYAQVKSGGLGLMSFTTRVPNILLGRLQHLTDRADDSLRPVLSSTFVCHLKEGLQHRLREIGTTPQTHTGYWTAQLEASPCGNGLLQVGHTPAASRWIADPPHTGVVETTAWRFSLGGTCCPPKEASIIPAGSEGAGQAI